MKEYIVVPAMEVDPATSRKGQVGYDVYLEGNLLGMVESLSQALIDIIDHADMNDLNGWSIRIIR